MSRFDGLGFAIIPTFQHSIAPLQALGGSLLMAES
jgi:hypothetical protein